MGTKVNSTLGRQTRNDRTVKIAEEKLLPIIRHFQKHGGTNEFADRISKRVGKKFQRQYIEELIHPDREHRVQPRFGLGLVIVEVGNEMIKESEAAK
jgi:hypothetical protein